MASSTLTERVRPRPDPTPGSKTDRWLGHPLAFLLTAAILLLIFGSTFVSNPGRPAPADDPAYYTWRTEALIENDPVTLLEATGPLDMYSGGYRVTTPVIASYFREMGGASLLTPTVLLAVGLRVVIPLLLAGFAYRQRRDPLIFHAVALGSASLLLTPPFGGYLDNVLTLFFLGASLFFIEPSRRSWPARLIFAGLLVLSGMTHPTTLVIFCVVLGAMAGARWLFRGFDLKSVIRDDGPMLASAFAAVVVTYLIWKVGIWGKSAPLSDAALPPPADAEFFKTRLGGWVEAMRPALNGPLFLIGAAGLLAAGKRAVEDELTRTAIVWLAPLAGIFGFLAGAAYPYYRFFNTTLSWILLVGVGIYFATRWFIGIARGPGAAKLALLGIVALALVIGTNFTSGLEQSHWNDASDAWLKPAQQEELQPVRAALQDVPPDTPVVFVVDDEAPEQVRIYGFAKLAGNVTRYAVPGEMQDLTSYYLGSLESYLAGEPSERDGDTYYRDLSEESLNDVREVNARSDREPVIIVASVFNATGANAELAQGPGTGTLDVGDAVVWVAGPGTLEPFAAPGESAPAISADTEPEDEGSFLRVLVMLAVLALLAVPGWLVMKSVFPEAGLSDALGLVPALAAGLLALAGIAVLAVARAPFGTGLEWAAYVLALIVGGLLFLRGRRSAASG
ncbi:MAG TPA: hypothetical protein VG318_10745 [Actinomycetota bacterium]|nr:hypothetical protein [Actinomycetota bacterium]